MNDFELSLVVEYCIEQIPPHKMFYVCDRYIRKYSWAKLMQDMNERAKARMYHYMPLLKMLHKISTTHKEIDNMVEHFNSVSKNREYLMENLPYNETTDYFIAKNYRKIEPAIHLRRDCMYILERRQTDYKVYLEKMVLNIDRYYENLDRNIIEMKAKYPDYINMFVRQNITNTETYLKLLIFLYMTDINNATVILHIVRNLPSYKLAFGKVLHKWLLEYRSIETIRKILSIGTINVADSADLVKTIKIAKKEIREYYTNMINETKLIDAVKWVITIYI